MFYVGVLQVWKPEKTSRPGGGRQRARSRAGKKEQAKKRNRDDRQVFATMAVALSQSATAMADVIGKLTK